MKQIKRPCNIPQLLNEICPIIFILFTMANNDMYLLTIALLAKSVNDRQF